MKSTAALIAFLILQIHCNAQTLNLGGPEKPNFYEEISYQQINGKIIIPVEIAGHTHKFLLDTGAPLTISDELAGELGITTTSQKSTRDAYGNNASVKSAPVSRIQLGATVFKDIPAFIGSNVLYQCLGVDGNIGSNLLRHTIISINSIQKKIIITDDSSKLTLNVATSTPMEINKDNTGSPYFILNTGGKVTGEYFIDTGDSGFMSLSNTYFDFFKKRQTCRVTATGYGANSGGQNGSEKNNVKYRVVFPEVMIAGTVFKNVKAETVFSSNGSGNNSVGTRLLDYGILTLDYLHGKLYFDALKSENDLTEKNWPLSPGLSKGKLAVGVVWDQFKALLKPGQEIIAIDGISCEQMTLCMLMTQKPILQDKEHAVLTVKDEEGKTYEVKIDKQ